VLECGVDASTANEWGMSLLHAAVAMDHTEKVRILVENGTDPNTTSQWGTTPISIAACNGCTRTVLSLVQEFDTDPNKGDNKGRTPVCAAAENGHAETVWCIKWLEGVQNPDHVAHRAQVSNLARSTSLTVPDEHQPSSLFCVQFPRARPL
jgi:ankyrin repeat protein